jgi:Hsp90 protein
MQIYVEIVAFPSHVVFRALSISNLNSKVPCMPVQVVLTFRLLFCDLHRMVLPDEVEKPVVPEPPKESADKQVDAPKGETEPVLSNVEIKKNIVKAEDEELKRRLADRLRFRTSSQPTSTLGEYVQRMVDEQNYIYYMVGRSPQQLARSPFVRRFVKAGLEVIYMTDLILDDLTVKKMDRRYGGFQLVSVNSETIELPKFSNQKADRIKRKREALDEFLPLCKRLKSVYSHEIHKIVISNTVQLFTLSKKFSVNNVLYWV